MMEAMCDLERYMNLIPQHWEPPIITNKECEVLSAQDKESDQIKEVKHTEIKDNSYKVPHEVPPGIELPKSENQYKIIKGTAEFYIKVGKEKFDKVHTTHKSNPAFSFLNREDSLYEYFKFLTKSPVQQQQQILLRTLEEEKRNSESEQERIRILEMTNSRENTNEQHNTPSIPSREICYVIEMVVNSVVEFGKGLEEKLKNSKEDQVYSFLKSGNIYRPYYDLRLKECTEKKMSQLRRKRDTSYNEDKYRAREEKRDKKRTGKKKSDNFKKSNDNLRKSYDSLPKLDENIYLEELYKVDQTGSTEESKKALRLEKVKAGLSLLLKSEKTTKSKKDKQ